jgi:hypothetical protein
MFERVLAHPLEGSHHVLGAGRPSMCGTEPIVGYDRDQARAREHQTGALALGFVAANETTAVKDDHHRRQCLRGRIRTVDIQAVTLVRSVGQIHSNAYARTRLVRQQRIVQRAGKGHVEHGAPFAYALFQGGRDPGGFFF